MIFLTDAGGFPQLPDTWGMHKKLQSTIQMKTKKAVVEKKKKRE